MKYSLTDILKLSQEEVKEKVIAGERSLACAWVNATRLTQFPVSDIIEKLELSYETGNKIIELRNNYLTNTCNKRNGKSSAVIMANLTYLACKQTEDLTSQDKICNYFQVRRAINKQNRTSILKVLEP